MFRIITHSFDPESGAPLPCHEFFLLCDNKRCKAAVVCQIVDDLGVACDPYLLQDITFQRIQVKFLTEAVQAGWGVGMEGQLCPFHQQGEQAVHARAREMARRMKEGGDGGDGRGGGKLVETIDPMAARAAGLKV